VSALAGRSSYCVLRVHPDTDASLWWAGVRQRRDVPDAIWALLAGRGRVELSRLQAERALEWAAGVEGWADAEPKPLYLYPS
jgi:hypothetical protein